MLYKVQVRKLGSLDIVYEFTISQYALDSVYGFLSYLITDDDFNYSIWIDEL